MALFCLPLTVIFHKSPLWILSLCPEVPGFPGRKMLHSYSFPGAILNFSNFLSVGKDILPKLYSVL